MLLSNLWEMPELGSQQPPIRGMSRKEGLESVAPRQVGPLTNQNAGTSSLRKGRGHYSGPGQFGGGAHGPALMDRRSGSPNMLSYLGMTFLVFTLSHCNPTLAIQGNIEPLDPVIEVGTDLSLTCTLTNVGGSQSSLPTVTSTPTAREIVWYKNEILLPADIYEIENQQTSRIRLLNASLQDAATYYCALITNDNAADFIGTVVHIGYQPQVSSLDCASHNVVDYYCWWVPVETHIPTTHLFEYIRDDRWRPCPSRDSGPNRCEIGMMAQDPGIQYVRVVSQNALGEKESHTYFNPDTHTIPLSPSNLTLKPIVSSAINATWEHPPTWRWYYETSLVFYLRYASEYETDNWVQLDLNYNLEKIIQGLAPYTSYRVQVACSYKYNLDDEMGEWSEEEEARTDESVPVGKVQNLRVGPDINNLEDPSYRRDVLVSWEPLPPEERRGVIIGYDVAVIPTVDCQSGERVNVTLTNTTAVVFENLEKFCTYEVLVLAYNSVGPGPQEKTIINDLTTAPLPPLEIRAETRSHQSALVSWAEPAQVNGYIKYYKVYWTDKQANRHSQNVSSTSLSVLIEDLECYSIYHFQVATGNKVGESGLSETASARTNESIPATAPTSVSASPDICNPPGLTLRWTEVTPDDACGIIRGHIVFYCLVGSLTSEPGLPETAREWNQSDCIEKLNSQHISSKSEEPSLTALQPFSTYLIWMSAYTVVGEGPRTDHPSVGETCETAPSEPINVIVSFVNATAIEVRWSPPSDRNGIIRNYGVEIKSNITSNPLRDEEVHEPPYLVEGLYGYETYSIQVQAFTTVWGSYSPTIYQLTDIGVPERPDRFDISSTSYRGVALSWEPPEHSNGPISHYSVSYRMLADEEEGTTMANVLWLLMVSSGQPESGESWTIRNTSNTELNLEMDCNKAGADGSSFLFRVAAVNKFVGESVEKSYKCCILPPTQLPQLIWLVLPAGIILLLALVISFYQLQAKFGKSWPDPFYPKIVKDGLKCTPVAKPKRCEKEEFDTIRVVPEADEFNNVILAEEERPVGSRGLSLLPPKKAADIDVLSRSKTDFIRTLSVDSGVPPSPQDRTLFLSSDDVFDASIDGLDWSLDTYCIGEPKVICHVGKSQKPFRSLSLGSSELGSHLPAIDEDVVLDKVAQRGGKWRPDKNPSPSPISSSDDREGPSHISGVPSSLFDASIWGKGKRDELVFADKFDDNIDRKTRDMSDDSNSHVSEEHINNVSSKMSSTDSGYVSSDSGYFKIGFQSTTAPNEAKSLSAAQSVHEELVSVPLVYSAIASPNQMANVLPKPTESSSGYISEESLVYTKLGKSQDSAVESDLGKSGNHRCATSLSPVSPSRPCPSEFLPYVTLDRLTYSKDGISADQDVTHEVSAKEPATLPSSPSPSSSSSADFSDQIADYVKGVDLAIPSVSQMTSSPPQDSKQSSVVSRQREPDCHSDIDSQNPICDRKEDAAGLDLAVRGGQNRQISLSSSSGYVSDSGIPPSNGAQEGVSPYADLAFSTSDSDLESDLDKLSDNASISNEDWTTICNKEEAIQNCNCGKSSFTEYIDHCNDNLQFVNDCPKSGAACIDTSKDWNVKDFPSNNRPEKTLGLPQATDSNETKPNANSVTNAEAYLVWPSSASEAVPRLQVPNSLSLNRAERDRALSECDNGYVQCSADTRYVEHISFVGSDREDYLPLSPIERSKLDDETVA